MASRISLVAAPQSGPASGRAVLFYPCLTDFFYPCLTDFACCMRFTRSAEPT
jgi:hypothetical protein